jgi:hypothetical protein
VKSNIAIGAPSVCVSVVVGLAAAVVSLASELVVCGCADGVGAAAPDFARGNAGCERGGSPERRGSDGEVLPALAEAPREELHVFGSYEARSGAERATRESVVRIERPGRHRLVVSAYEPVRWRIEAAPGAEIVQVVAVGYHAQEVVLGPGVDAEIRKGSYEHGGPYACGYSWPYNGGGCDTRELLDLAAREVGRTVTSFHGCYQVDRWRLMPDLSVVSSCDSDGGGYEPYEHFPGIRP